MQVPVAKGVAKSDDAALSVEDALAAALLEATRAGQWGVVSQLAKELEARRLEGSNVVALPTGKRGAK